MSLIGRASKLLKVAELRRDTVNAVAREKLIDKRVVAAGELAGELEEEAALALENGNEILAKRILGERVDALKARASLRDELGNATKLASRLKTDLVRMEEQALDGEDDDKHELRKIVADAEVEKELVRLKQERAAKVG